MKFDLSKVDFTKEVTDQLKSQYHEQVTQLIKNGESDNDHNRMVTLFHGTSLKRLNPILLHGLAPNEITGNKNYEGKLEANPSLVYLTKKWHYWYAYESFLKKEKQDIDQKGETEEDTIYNVPCYVECSVPASRLIIDEDFFHSKYVKNRIKSTLKKKQHVFELTYEECLNEYATVAHIGNIERANMVSFTLLVNFDVLKKNFIDESSRYQKELRKWGNGKGKGTLTFEELLKLEDDPANLTFYMKEIPDGFVITHFVPKDDDNLKFSLHIDKWNGKEFPFNY